MFIGFFWILFVLFSEAVRPRGSAGYGDGHGAAGVCAGGAGNAEPERAVRGRAAAGGVPVQPSTPPDAQGSQ